MKIAVLGLVALILSGCISADQAKKMSDHDLVVANVGSRKMGATDVPAIESEIRSRNLFTADEWMRIQDNLQHAGGSGGNFRVGDTKMFVLASVGQPSRSYSREDASGVVQVWDYRSNGFDFVGSIVFKNDRIVSIYR